MSESITQGIPALDLGSNNLKLLKCNDISFSSLKRAGFNCLDSRKKPDQLVIVDGNIKNIIIGIEDKLSSMQLDEAIRQIKDNYLSALPNTKYFIARAGERVEVFYRISQNKIIEIGTTKRGRQVQCFGPSIITGENPDIQSNLLLFAIQVLADKPPVNGSIEIDPPREYFNPLLVNQTTIYSLWQKIFVCTGEQAHTCLDTFVELLLYKGISDAGILPNDYRISSLINQNRTNSLDFYNNTIRNHIKTRLFPTAPNQPGVINGFAFEGQETVFKDVLKDLDSLGNLAQRQLDPDFKRRIIEAFLGSANKEGSIKNGQHLTPRNIIQAIWRMANPPQGVRIVDPACGVGGFILEGLNYPYEFNYRTFNCIGLDRSKEMIILAKANMILHLLDKLASGLSNVEEINRIVHSTFLHVDNNGTGTLGELIQDPDDNKAFTVKHPADFVLTNVPFFTNGVGEIEKSLKDNGNLDIYYKSCGLGVEARFIKYILGQIKNGNPGIAYIIIPDGVLYRVKDNVREVIKQNADVLGIISLPKGCFQNNDWKTSILIIKKKTQEIEYSPVFLYNVEHIGISLDSFRTPTEHNDLPNLITAWERRLSGSTEDPKCRLVSRDEFNRTERWIDLFSWCNIKDDSSISFSEFVESIEEINRDISNKISEADRTMGSIFTLERSRTIKLSDTNYFITKSPDYKTTIKFARLNPGKYPLFSSGVDGPVEYMFNTNIPPVLIENETKRANKKIISWNIKGDAGKDVRLHTEPFYCTENRGLIEVINPELDIEYVLYYLKEHLINDGAFSRANEAHVGKVKQLSIKVPLREDGSIDLEKQKQIADNYKYILELKNLIHQNIMDMNKLITQIDVFK